MATPNLLLLLPILLLILSASASRELDDLDFKSSSSKGRSSGIPFFGFFPPNGRFNIPGYSGNGGGWGGGYGGPSGGHTWGGIEPTSVLCRERGPCYKKKLTCPAKCFTSYSHAGKGYGGGGGGAGCTVDCRKHCVAYC